jgi:hypothetical protein
MKQKLLTLFLTIFISSFIIAQTPGQNQTDDFEDATEQGWKHGISTANDPVNVSTDGPAGAGDNFLRNMNGLVGNRHIMLNQDARWLGNYTGQGIVAIRMDVRNSGVNDLHLRVAFRGGVGPSWMATTNAVVVAPGATWVTIEIPILASDFVITEDNGDSREAILLSQTVAGQIRILSNNNSPASIPNLHKGDQRTQISEYDNIRASTTLLSIKEQKPQSTFSINPNPGSNKLNLKLSRLNDDTTIEVFDVLGKKVYAERLYSTSKSIDVFKWNSGVYLVRITSDDGTQTKRFVKQ